VMDAYMDQYGPGRRQALQRRIVDGSGWITHGESLTGHGHAINDDNFALLPLANNRVFMAVADGLGGHNTGYIASLLACETLAACARRDEADLIGSSARVVPTLAAMVHEAHAVIARRSRAVAACRGMGCTLTAVVASAGEAWFCHVGDSRFYRIGLEACEQISTDHRIATGHGNHLLRQALGMEDECHPLDPQSGTITLARGDALLLCSDGLHDRVDDGELARLVRGRSPVAERVRELIDASLAAGGQDDITVVLATFGVEPGAH
jgi:serine/threonine protein phosphatase PrpC